MKISSQSEIQTITPAMASKFLEENNFYLQRRIKGSHINSLALAMKNGEFPPGTPLCFVQTPKKLELIDGQHRLRAQVVSGLDVDYSVVTLTSDDEKASGMLYTQFDIGAKRTVNDRLKALNVTEYVDLPLTQANLLAAAAPYLKYRFGKMTPLQMSQITPLQRLEILKEFEQGAIQFFECINSAHKWLVKPLMKPYFVALGAYLFQYAPETAAPLWKAIASNTCGDSDDPRHHLMNLVLDVTTKGSGTGLGRTTAIAQAFIHGWNAMVEGKRIAKKLTPAPVPSEVANILGVKDDWFVTPESADEAKAAAEQEKQLVVDIAQNVMVQIKAMYPISASSSANQ